ncbi:lysozyme inhibitor LprI family protein [Paraburkholderia sp. C35]|uniref:lysozyme inhibitor LprI family protein n=1 Tax=Paraburkholderia sp. C35 TaxID=2126993 RepID=UPI0019525CF5|nr:lysozyme inhibitor LprI family protein [Paraburkholderia sp. C35]
MKTALRWPSWHRARVIASAAALLAAWLAAPGAAHAEVAAADPIDASMRTCLARADMSSTVGQVQCMDTARIAWKASMDQSLQQLQSDAPDAQRKKWEDSQKRWLAWREADGKLLAAVLATTHGTAYQLAGADIQLQPVRDRALALRAAAAASGKQDPKTRPRACSFDAQCEHAMFDLNRYYRRLHAKLPSHARPLLSRAQRAWTAYRDATVPLMDARSQIDIIGTRVAQLKRMGDTAGND